MHDLQIYIKEPHFHCCWIQFFTFHCVTVCSLVGTFMALSSTCLKFGEEISLSSDFQYTEGEQFTKWFLFVLETPSVIKFSNKHCGKVEWVKSSNEGFTVSFIFRFVVVSTRMYMCNRLYQIIHIRWIDKSLERHKGNHPKVKMYAKHT